MEFVQLLVGKKISGSTKQTATLFDEHESCQVIA